MRRRAVFTLFWHFVGSIARPPLLSDLGADFLRRTLASVVAMLFVAGIFLTRALFKRYVDLHASWDETAYHQAVQSDTLMMIGVPMVLVGLITALLAPMLLPDETDYRTLSPLPITRKELFASKFLAVAATAIIAVLAVNTVTSLWFPLAIGGRWALHPLVERAAAHAIATLVGSLWAFASVMAIQGLCVALAPARWRHRTSSIVLGATFLLLLLSVPYVVRFPTLVVNAATAGEWPALWIPPVWFLGIQQLLLDPQHAGGYVAAGQVGAGACGVVVVTIALVYALLFGSAERLALDPVNVARRQPNFGMSRFVAAGLTRSGLHQAVLALIIGAGVAISISQMLTLFEGASFRASRPRAVVDYALMTPLLAALTVAFALQMTFRLPLEQRAAWLFRVTEAPRSRRRALDTVTRFFEIGVVGAASIPIILLHPYVLGVRSPVAATLTVLACLVLVELVVRDWRRVPYTCTYLPGKRVLAYTLGVLLGSYAAFVYLGANIIRWALGHPSRLMFIGGLLLAVFAALRRERLRGWEVRALEFEDEDPLAIRTLNLLPDER